jgi:hypothetical protein
MNAITDFEALTRGNAFRNDTRHSTYKSRNVPALPTDFVSSVAAAVDSESWRTFVTGPPPRLDQLVEHPSAPGFTIYGDGHFPTMRRKGKVIQWSAQWFADDPDPIEADTRWHRLDRALRRAFHGTGLHTTPGTTGRALWLESIGRYTRHATMSPEMQTWIRSNSGQGRNEMFPARSTISTVHESDARWAYAALLRNLPVGLPVAFATACDLADIRHANPFADGFASVEWSAPAGWDHVGILPMRGEGSPMFPRSGAGVVSLTELDLAERCGWTTKILGGMAWLESADPMRTWLNRLVRIANNEPDLARAIRSIVLHTIGGIHGADRRRTEYGQEPPEGAQRVRLLTGGDMMAWTITEPAAWPDTHHPEWSSLIWSRARRRLLDAPAANGVRCGALSLPADQVVAFRTDAIFTTHDPQWPDDGAVGRYRSKGHHAVTDWPATSRELLAAKRAR